jgi:hypothetical protein
MMRQFATGVRWEAPDTAKEVDALVQRMLVELVAAYLTGGNEALSAIDDRSVPTRFAEEFRRLLDNSSFVVQHPSLRDYLLGFPNAQLSNANSILHWSNAKFGLKPVVSVTHLTTVDLGAGESGPTLLMSKQLYATHYFDASLGLTLLIDAGGRSTGGATYLLYLGRTRTGSLQSRWRWWARSLVASRSREGVERMLTATRQRVEQDYKATSSR